MAALMPLWLYCEEENEIAQMNAIKAQMRDTDEMISLHDLYQLCDEHHRSEKFYSLARCIGKLHALKGTENGKELELQFEEINIGTNVTLNRSGLIDVKFMNESAVTVDNMILNGKLTAGDILVIRQPIFKEDVLEDEDVSLVPCERILIELGTTQNCNDVKFWQCRSNMYIDSYLVPCEYYYYISVYNVENIGSINHIITNLLHVIKGKGSVMPLKDIVNCKVPNIFIALTEFKELVCPLKEYKDHKEIQMSFEEVILNDIETNLPKSSTVFKAYFFNDVAEELQIALKRGHLEHGDLIALCYPFLDKMTAAPLNISFLPDKGKNLIILKNQVKDSIKTTVSEYEINADQPIVRTSKRRSEDIVFLNTEYNCVDVNIDFFYLNNFSDKTDALMQIKDEIERHGKIINLNSFLQQDLLRENNCIILSYFLKIVSPLVKGQRKKTVILARELDLDCRYSVFIKVTLYDEFALRFYLGVKEKQIVRGDIISFVNPFVFPNHTFMSIYLTEEPYQLELSSIKSTQRIMIFKLKRNMNQRKETTKTSTSPSQLNSQLCCPLCLRKDQMSTNVYPKQLTEKENIFDLDCTVIRAMKPHSGNNDYNERSWTKKEYIMDESETMSTAIRDSLMNKNSESNNSFDEGCPVTSTMKPNNGNKDCSIQSSAVTKITCEKDIPQRLVPFSLGSEIGETEVIPIRVTKPCLCNDLDFISGYCSLSCHSLFVHSAIVWNEQNEPTCPKCRLKLRLILCFELDIITKGREHASVWLYDKYAENFLGVTFKEFLNSGKARETAKKSLNDKLLPTYQGELFSYNYKFRLSDLSNFARGEIFYQ